MEEEERKRKKNNNAKFSGHYVYPRTETVRAHALRSHQFEFKHAILNMRARNGLTFLILVTPEPQDSKRGSGKSQRSSFQTYVRPVHFQGHTSNEKFKCKTRSEKFKYKSLLMLTHISQVSSHGENVLLYLICPPF